MVGEFSRQKSQSLRMPRPGYPEDARRCRMTVAGGCCSPAAGLLESAAALPITNAKAHEDTPLLIIAILYIAVAWLMFFLIQNCCRGTGAWRIVTLLLGSFIPHVVFIALLNTLTPSGADRRCRTRHRGDAECRRHRHFNSGRTKCARQIRNSPVPNRSCALRGEGKAASRSRCGGAPESGTT